MQALLRCNKRRRYAPLPLSSFRTPYLSFVIPGRIEDASPESISPGCSGGPMDSGFALWAPRNDARQATAPSRQPLPEL
jgi:hypothetical protein